MTKARRVAPGRAWCLQAARMNREGAAQQVHAKPHRMRSRLRWRRCNRDGTAGATVGTRFGRSLFAGRGDMPKILKGMEHCTHVVKKINNALAVRTGKRKGIGGECRSGNNLLYGLREKFISMFQLVFFISRHYVWLSVCGKRAQARYLGVGARHHHAREIIDPHNFNLCSPCTKLL